MPLASPPIVGDPITQPDIWDRIGVNGAQWGGPPVGGKIEIRGASRFYKIDQKDAKGQDGSTQTYVGTHPKPFRLIFIGWTADQWFSWNQFFLPQFFYSGVIGKVYPLVVSHPSLALLGITRILTEDIGSTEIDTDSKMFRTVLTVREYYPAVLGNASVTPLGPPAPSVVGFTPALSTQLLQQQAQASQQRLKAGAVEWPSNQ